MTLYDRIRQLRIDAGMSQDDLARAMGYKDRSMITKIELGKVDISQKKILAFAKVLNTTPAYLMGWTDEQEEKRPLNLQIFNNTVSSSEARIISGGVDRMPPEKREQALKILQVAFSEFFKEDTDNDT